jgi:hypothetical protein
VREHTKHKDYRWLPPLSRQFLLSLLIHFLSFFPVLVYARCLVFGVRFVLYAPCQIEDVVAKLSGDLKQLEKDADEFRLKYNIQMGDPAQQGQQQQQGGGGAAQEPRGQSLLA